MQNTVYSGWRSGSTTPVHLRVPSEDNIHVGWVVDECFVTSSDYTVPLRPGFYVGFFPVWFFCKLSKLFYFCDLKIFSFSWYFNFPFIVAVVRKRDSVLPDLGRSIHVGGRRGKDGYWTKSMTNVDETRCTNQPYGDRVLALYGLNRSHELLYFVQYVQSFFGRTRTLVEVLTEDPCLRRRNSRRRRWTWFPRSRMEIRTPIEGKICDFT